MSIRTRTWVAALASGPLALSCAVITPITQPVPQSGSADFGVYVAMGTSVTAGWESGGLVDRHQIHSYPYLFARQAGTASFTIPSVSPDGLPALLRIVSLSPLVISNAGRPQGSATNAGQSTAYHNMAVPYSVLFDVTDTTYYYSPGPFQRPTFPFDLVVRHRGTILGEALSLNPTFVSVEYGANEVLGPASSGNANVPFTPTQFAGLLDATLDALQAAAPQAKLALLTVPDVSSIPFFTTFPPFTVSLTTGQPVPLIGPGGTPLAPGDCVLLTAGPSLAAGDGFPPGSYNYVNPSQPGNGTPLADTQVLSAAEKATLQATAAGYNTAIRDQAATRGAALVDLAGLLTQAATSGHLYQGTTYNADFVTGGLFSLDGIHPTDLAHGILCNAMIDAVNSTFGARIPRVDLSQAATATSSRLRPGGEPRKLYPVLENAGDLCPRWSGGTLAAR